jgi:hypothetical protein
MPGCQDDDIPGDVPFDVRSENTDEPQPTEEERRLIQEWRRMWPDSREKPIILTRLDGTRLEFPPSPEPVTKMTESEREYAERIINKAAALLLSDQNVPFTHVNLEDGTITVDEEGKALEAHLDDIASRLLRGETDIDPVVDLGTDRITRLERSVNDIFGQRNSDYGDALNILTSRSRYDGASWHPLGHIKNELLDQDVRVKKLENRLRVHYAIIGDLIRLAEKFEKRAAMLEERSPRCGLGPGDPCDPWTEVHNTIATLHGTVERLQERSPRCGLGPGDPCDPWTEVHNTIATLHGTVERLQERVDILERACRRHGVNIETEYRPETGDSWAKILAAIAAYHAIQHPVGG